MSKVWRNVATAGCISRKMKAFNLRVGFIVPLNTNGRINSLMRSKGWSLRENGRVGAAEFIASENFDSRPVGVDIRLLVVHCISLPPGCFNGGHVESFFTNTLDFDAHPYFRTIRGLKVSAHFFIDRSGHLKQFVSCAERAWHAGASAWRGISGCNDFSIGIELEGQDTQEFESAQYETLLTLARVLMANFPIEACVGHSDIATPTGRKRDPGTKFDWSRLRVLEGIELPS
ncbi:MAG: 1,6-anhydro-N-acetylmuramyl-L-alanine amidase AmpD [Betaproteobacteria bacterium]